MLSFWLAERLISLLLRHNKTPLHKEIDGTS
jgi:hypothetical protein